MNDNKLELAIRISTHLLSKDKVWTSVEMVDDLKKHNSVKNIKSKIEIHRSYWTTETHDMNGKKVHKHQHGYLQVSGVSLPTFRKIFKTYILKLDKFVSHKRGNSLYSISKVTTNQAQYCSYISKNLILDKNVDTYLKNPFWYNFTREEIQVCLNSWLKMKSAKTTFASKRSRYAKAIEMLEKRFQESIGLWVKCRSRPDTRHTVNNLTLEYIKLNVKFGIQWKKYQIESKMNLWWYSKYPLQLESYVNDLF